MTDVSDRAASEAIEDQPRASDPGDRVREATSVIELRLPLDPAYQALLRTTAGAVAGITNLDPVETMEIQVAVSEVFDLTANRVADEQSPSKATGLTFRFMRQPGRLAILASLFPPSVATEEYTVEPEAGQECESRLLLGSLMDDVKFDGDSVLMVKRVSAQDGSSRR